MFKYLKKSNLKRKIKGSIDEFADSFLMGWVLDDYKESSIKIEVSKDGEILAECFNDIYREDIVQAGLAKKPCGFKLNLHGISLIDLHESKILCNGVQHDDLTKSFCDLVYENSKHKHKILIREDSSRIVQGNIDLFRGFILNGWVVAQDKKSDVLVEVVLEDQVIGQSINELYREDIIDAGITDNSSGFTINLQGIQLTDLLKSEIHCNGIRHNVLTEIFHDHVRETDKDFLPNKNFKGYVDAFDNYILRGWVISKNEDVDVLVEVVFKDNVLAFSSNNNLREDVIVAKITDRPCGFEVNLVGISFIDLHKSEIHCNGTLHENFTNVFHDLVYKKENEIRLDNKKKNNSQGHIIDSERFHSAEIESKYWRQLSKKLVSNNSQIDAIDLNRFYQDLEDELYLSSIVHQKDNLDLNSRKSLFEDKAKEFFERDLEKFDLLLDFERDEYLDLTVILILYNKAELTYRCLKSLSVLKKLPKIVVIDNASSDKSSELMSKCNGITYIKNKENVGFLKACNQARRFIDTEYLLLLNNDSVIEENAIDEAITTFETYDNIGVVGAKILHLDGLLQEAGSIIWNDGSCLGYGRRQSPYLPQYNYLRDVDFVSGAFFLMPTSIWDKVGGFDEAFYPYYYEEVDLCMRIRSHGYRIVYQPKSIITHFEYASSKNFDSAFEQMRKNLSKFYDKHKIELEMHYDSNEKNIEVAAHRGIKPNLLFVEDQIPFDELGSGFPRSRRIILELKKYFNVLVFPFIGNHFYKEDFEYENVMLMRANKNADIDTLARMSPNIEKVWISRPHNVPRFVESGLYDKIRSGSTQVIYDAEAIFSEREKIRCELFNQEFDKKIQEDEIELLSKADLVVSVSDKEKKLLSNHTDKKIFKVAHPMSFKNAEYDNFDNREDILFVGNMQGDRLISPNVDSIYYFMSSFGESLQKAGIPIRLVGAIDKEHQDNWESLGAICEGRVDDLKPFFDKAIISIAPTRFAAGIPHKVHESLAHGVPVMYTKLIGSQISEPLIENALIENLNPELLSNKAQLEDLFKEQIKGCTNDMSEDEFEYEIKKISQNT